MVFLASNLIFSKEDVIGLSNVIKAYDLLLFFGVDSSSNSGFDRISGVSFYSTGVC